MGRRIGVFFLGVASIFGFFWGGLTFYGGMILQVPLGTQWVIDRAERYLAVTNRTILILPLSIKETTFQSE